MASAIRLIGLDGPAGSGKSTVGQLLAQRLGFFYFDTGVLYRALTWLALEKGVSPEDGPGLARLAAQVRVEVRPATASEGRQFDVLVDRTDVSWQIFEPRVDRQVSTVAAHGEVRQALIAAQRQQARWPGTVVVGRDIGTVIFPEAELKIFLAASPQERARRRQAQAASAGHQLDFQETLQGIEARDRQDSTRAAAPLIKAADAVEIDTDGLTPEQVVDRIAHLVHSPKS